MTTEVKNKAEQVKEMYLNLRPNQKERFLWLYGTTKFHIASEYMLESMHKYLSKEEQRLTERSNDVLNTFDPGDYSE